LRACDAKKLSGSDGGENKVSLRELCNFVIDFYTAAKMFQMPSEGIWESLSAAPKNGPAIGVTGSHESQSDGG
jgi:hypothetical protein